MKSQNTFSMLPGIGVASALFQQQEQPFDEFGEARESLESLVDEGEAPKVRSGLNIRLQDCHIIMTNADIHSICDRREFTPKVIDAWFLLAREMNNKALRK
jgi:hypothetical protein